MMAYRDFFRQLTGYTPFRYQERLADGPWPELLEVPTGLGKTAAVVIAWLYRRMNGDVHTPARLVYCLPMRVLVEQTRENTQQWLSRAAPLFKEAGADLPGVSSLMGGEHDTAWAGQADRPAIIIGTQDMLLSRALMRGYGMSRYLWPVHFALLHNDVLWVFDEIQLMGAGLATSAQLEAFRRALGTARPGRSLWMSATLNPAWLATLDLGPHMHSFRRMALEPNEEQDTVVCRRRSAAKRLMTAATTLTRSNRKSRAGEYAASLAQEILAAHVPGTTTLVVLNNVARAQALLSALDRMGPGAETLLVHSRFRPPERAELNRALTIEPDAAGPGRIIVATQAVEAGVDISSRVLFTELAPWSSLVQRFGRCNRYGEAGAAGGLVVWIDIEPDTGLELPYTSGDMDGARQRLARLVGVSAAELPAVDDPVPVQPLLRRRDFLDLFNTDPDLSGFDVDISPYIRDTADTDIQFFWRDLDGDPSPEITPSRDELCRASPGQAAELLKRLKKGSLTPYAWDSLDERWLPFRGRIRPGLVLLLDCAAGGYCRRYGFQPGSREPVKPAPSAGQSGPDGYSSDWRSRTTVPVSLERHLDNTLALAREFCQRLGLTGDAKEAVLTAAARHDVGKAMAVFQATMHGCSMEEAGARRPLLAKSALNGRHRRRYFRHEVASMLAWLSRARPGPGTDLVAYLIAAHHGKVRMSLRAMPGEQAPSPGLGPRYARGVWEGEELPGVELPGGDTSPATRMDLAVMELGRGKAGMSWTERTWRLLEHHGPFRLAWLETLVRLADWRASAEEQEV